MSEVQFHLWPHQKKFVKSNSRFLMNSGGVGSGKTYSNVFRAIRLLVEYPGIVGMLGAKTFPQLRDTTMREFFSLCPQDIIKEYKKSDKIVQFVNGSELFFRQYDDEIKIKSYTLGFAGIEEATDVDEAIFNQLRLRTRQDGMPGYIFGSTNPSTFSNWVYKNFVDEQTKLDTSEIIYSTSFDNKDLPPDYLKDLEKFRFTNPEYYERMVKGQWGALEGLIYNFPMQYRKLPNWFKSYDTAIAGVDFGFNHPFALVVILISGERYYIVKEVYRRNLTSSEISALCKEQMERWGIEVFYCDGSRPEIIEDLKRDGLPATDAIKHVFDGIMYVKGLIDPTNERNNRLFVDGGECPYTCREFDSYIWDKEKKEKETPLKINDDAMDALRYGIYSHASQAFEIVNLGDLFSKR